MKYLFGKTGLLTVANIRKSKGQALSFFIMILMASTLLNIGLLTWRNYNQNFDSRAEELNSADVIITIQNGTDSYSGKFEQELLADERTRELETRDVLFLPGTCKYGTSDTTRSFAIMNETCDFKIGNVSYVEKLSQIPEDAVYLPYLFESGGNYKLGDTFAFTVNTAEQGEKTFTYTIAGFFEESMLATINSTTTGLIFSENAYENLADYFSGNVNGRMFLVQLWDQSKNEAFGTTHFPDLTDHALLFDVVFYDSIKMARTITSSIGSMIIIAFSIIIVGISLIIIKFRIGNSIEEDMQNIGALKAIGYTGSQITAGIALQFLSIGFIGTLLGTGLSYLILPVISQMFAAQTGVIWKQGFDIISSSICCIFVLAAIYAVAMLSTKQARKLQPIAALRTGIVTHSFRRNPLPLERCHGGLTIRLAGKTFYQNRKQNLLVGIIIAAISFTTVFAGVLYDNISLRFDHFLSATVGELNDVMLSAINHEAAEELLTAVREDDAVRKAFYVSVGESVKAEGDNQIICYVTEDFAQYDNQNIIYQERFPQYENEAAIGGLIARQLGKSVGDMILLEQNGIRVSYLITGLIQGSNYLGRDAALTEDGYRKMFPDFEAATISVYLNENEDIDTFIDGIQLTQKEKLVNAVNNKKLITASMGTYRSIVEMLVLVVLFVTVGMIALTLSLVVKAMLIRKKTDLGIEKSNWLQDRTAYSTNGMQLFTGITARLRPWLCCRVGFCESSAQYHVFRNWNDEGRI